jgi:hypothetical protein
VSLGDTVSLGELLLALGTTLLAGGLAVGSALQRIKALEEKAQGWDGIDARLTRVETEVLNVKDDVTEIKGDVKEALRELRSFSPGARPRRQ